MASFALIHHETRAGTRRGRSLARGIESLVRDARRPPRYLTSAVPFRVDAVRAAAPELLDLAALLRTKADPSPRGLALADRLVTDPAGPVYADCGEDLRGAAVAAREALEETDR